jgi:nucleotide-binding universal stress UspA family protein
MMSYFGRMRMFAVLLGVARLAQGPAASTQEDYWSALTASSQKMHSAMGSVRVSVPPHTSPDYTPEMAVRKKELRKGAKETLAHAIDLLRKAGFKADSRVVESEIKRGILTVASEWDANLIVVTSHARKGVSKFLHRSVAQSIVHRAPCSVLVVKESVKKAAA